jgi:hypothetical protein
MCAKSFLSVTQVNTPNDNTFAKFGRSTEPPRSHRTWREKPLRRNPKPTTVEANNVEE